MNDIPYAKALIVGSGQGISASVARALAGAGVKVALAARNVAKLDALAAEIDGRAFAVDAASPESVARLFADVDTSLGPPDVVLYNAGARLRGVHGGGDRPAARPAPAGGGRGDDSIAQLLWLVSRRVAWRL